MSICVKVAGNVTMCKSVGHIFTGEDNEGKECPRCTKSTLKAKEYKEAENLTSQLFSQISWNQKEIEKLFGQLQTEEVEVTKVICTNKKRQLCLTLTIK